MAEAPSTANPAAPAATDPSNGGGTPPAPTPPAPSASDIDLSKLPADQLAKALENPELWKLPRVAELLDSQKQLKKLQTEQSQNADKQLEEQKKFEELANKRGDEVTSLTTQLQTERVNNALTVALSKESAVDLDAAIKLIDRSKVTVDENGSVQGIQEAVDALKTEKSYLFTPQGTPPRVGAPSNQGGGQQPPAPGVAKFKRSQLQGPEGQKFYQDNAKEINAAYAAGEIEDDVTPR